MRILIVGDVVGRPGRHACARLVPRLIREHKIDFVLANGENAAAGSGITAAIFSKLRNMGIDACTLGDHIYKRREVLPLLESSERVVKSANLPPEAVGQPLIIVPGRNGARVAVFSLLGRTYMNVRADCPFHAADRVLGQIPRDVKIVLVDVHAETTSEKVALGWYLNGKVTAVFGTHTHVPTADERILPGGTAYITDVGMTGPYDSVLGRDRDAVIKALVTGMPHPYEVASRDVRLSGVIVEADPGTGRALAIERVFLPEESPPPPDEP
jgi:metallophosphoesterase (TIGR00282 family)